MIFYPLQFNLIVLICSFLKLILVALFKDEQQHISTLFLHLLVILSLNTSTYRSYYDFSETLDSVPWGVFYSMYFIEMDSINTSHALSCPGTGFSSYSYTYLCDNSGNILFIIFLVLGLFAYGSYFYDDNGLAILNNLQPLKFPPVNLNTSFNSYDIQWADTNKLCTVTDSSNVISSYIFDEEGILLIIIMFQISHLILILQLFYITMII